MKYIYLANHRDDIYEGGMSRNTAFYNYFKEKEFEIIHVYSKKKLDRFLDSIYVLMYFLFSKGNVFFLHQSCFLLIFPIISWKGFSPIYHILFNHFAKRNVVHIEVNDLSIEQSIDLGIKCHKSFSIFQDVIYSNRDFKFVYASYEMMNYNIEKYNQISSNSQVILNGGNMITVDLEFDRYIRSSIINSNSKVNCIYAGSLDRVEDIKWMLENFKYLEDKTLYLMGSGGEWLYEIDLPYNIKYIGKFSEERAQSIVNKCDIGLVPYDDNKFYYNLCYPSKYAFYLTSGIPFLSTNLKESRQNLSKFNVGLFVNKGNMFEKLRCINEKEIKIMKENIDINKQFFLWKDLLMNLKL